MPPTVSFDATYRFRGSQSNARKRNSGDNRDNQLLHFTVPPLCLVVNGETATSPLLTAAMYST